MKNFLKITFLFLSFILSMELRAQTQSVIVLEKNETYVSPQPDMIVMDKYTFAEFFYTVEKYDTLTNEVLVYDSLVNHQKAQYDSLQIDYEHLIILKDAEIKTYSDGYEKMKGIARDEIQAKEKLQVDYIKLSEKHSKAKRWRNLFMGASALLSGFIVLSVTH
jgi:hypothetical protein